MDQQHRCMLYKNAPLTLFDSYHAIEKFIIDARLAFIDQYKLFDLLNQLLPKDDNHLTCQGFLSWLVWRVDQHEEDEQERRRRQSLLDKRFFPQTTEVPSLSMNKRFKTVVPSSGSKDRGHLSSTSTTEKSADLPSGSHHHQRLADTTTHSSSDMQEQIDRLQSIVLRLASDMDTHDHPSEVTDASPSYLESAIKHEQPDDVGSRHSSCPEGVFRNEPSEFEAEEELSDGNPPPDYPASTSAYPTHSTTTKTIMYQGRNMMKHLRPRTTLTSFARHVASDLFSREEIMAKLHVDHNHERDIFLRHCICTAWNLMEQDLFLMWPKIRNALLQLRRDAIAGKCIRMTSRKRPANTPISYQSDYDDDDSQQKSDLCK